MLCFIVYSCVLVVGVLVLSGDVKKYFIFSYKRIRYDLYLYDNIPIFIIN